MKNIALLLTGSLATYLLMRRAMREKQQGNELLWEMNRSLWKTYQDCLRDAK